jgi:hypothetical protein
MQYMSGAGSFLDTLHPQSYAYYGALARWDLQLSAAQRARYNQFFVELEVQGALACIARMWVVGASLDISRIDLIAGERARLVGNPTLTPNVSLAFTNNNGLFTQCSPLSLAVQNDKYAAGSKHLSVFKTAHVSNEFAIGAQLLAGGAVRNYLIAGPTEVDTRLDGDSGANFPVSSNIGHYLYTMAATTGAGVFYEDGAPVVGSGSNAFSSLVDGPWGLGGFIGTYDPANPASTVFVGSNSYFAWTIGNNVTAAQAAVIRNALVSLKADLPTL